MLLFKALLILLLGIFGVKSQSEIKGPPTAETKLVKKVGHQGESLRLPCPIEGFPTPFIEWFKGDEKIDDFSWNRFKVSKKVLKIRSAEVDDTGIYHCKGVNGFGTENVRIELIVVDRSVFSNPRDTEIIDPAPPVFTPQTKNAPRMYRKSFSESFQLSCEALGNPNPDVDWLKDGQIVQDTLSIDGLSSSTLNFGYLTTSDAGTYTCRATNKFGKIDISFTLEVSGSSYLTNTNTNPINDGISSMVTEAGPRNGTVEQGSTAVLFCKVKSLVSPHVQWLKKLDLSEQDPSEVSSVIQVAGERFRVLDSKFQNPPTTDKQKPGEFIDKLTIKNVQPHDSGNYICFVTSNGIGKLSYKEVFLNVVPANSPPGLTPSQVHTSSVSFSTSEGVSNSLMIILIVVALIVIFIVLIVGAVLFVLRKRGKDWNNTKNNNDNVDSLKLESHQTISSLPPSLHLSCESRPFLVLNSSDKLSDRRQFYTPDYLHQMSNYYEGHHQPVPSITGQWSNTVYPIASFGHQKSFQSKSIPLSHRKSNFGPTRDFDTHPQQVRLNGDYEFPLQCVSSHPVSATVDRNNVYEVPYSHLFRSQCSPEEWGEIRPMTVTVTSGQKSRPQPLGGSTNLSNHSISKHSQNKSDSMQIRYKEYESCCD